MEKTKIKGAYINGNYCEFSDTDSQSQNPNWRDYSQLLLPNTTTVIETAMNYVLKLEEGNLKLSKDLGKTWTTKENTYGTIEHAHFFGDGTLLFCTPTAAYYTKDLVTINQATILDIDGNAWNPNGYHFFWQQKFDSVEVIDGKEIHYWGDYILSGVTHLWYTVDNGHTIKTAFKFGTSKIDGNTIACRHCHQFIYNKYDGKFYVTTGDNITEINLMRGTYDVQNDTWTWELLGNGSNYKFGQLLFDRNFMYAITDYAGVGQTFTYPKGILKCPMDKIGTPEAWTNAWEDYDGEVISAAGLVSLLIDGNGNKLLTIDSYQPGFVFVTDQGFKFKKMRLDGATQFGIRFTGPNYNGDYYATYKTFDGTQNACSLSFYPTMNVKEMLALNGIKWNTVLPFDLECVI